MKSKMFLVCAAALVMLTSTAGQATAGTGGIKLIQFGVKAGMQAYGFKIKHSNDLGTLAADGKLGYQFGLMSRVNLGGIYIQPELVYSANSFKLREGRNDAMGTVRIKNFEIPVLVGFKIPFVTLFAGPVFNLSNDTKNLDEGSQVAIHSNFDKYPIAFQAGVGINLWDLTLDVRYHGQFKAPVQSMSVGGQQAYDVKTRMNGWQINLGYFF